MPPVAVYRKGQDGGVQPVWWQLRYLNHGLTRSVFPNPSVMKSFLPVFLFIFLASGVQAQPIAVHPDNPHYFVFQGKPAVLVTSGEHYGSLVNKSFDFRRYLATLQKIGLNHTRVFSGDYVEQPGGFCTVSSPVKVAHAADLLAPWKRSSTPGFSLGGNKFDLSQWDEAYFERLHQFMQDAAAKNIVVEVVLFFVGPGWKDYIMNPANNVNGTSPVEGKDCLTLNNGNILEHQKRYCLKMVRELNRYDHVIFNIVNEPWFENQQFPGFVSPARQETHEWIREVSEWITEEEKRLPKQHLLSVDYSNEGSLLTEADARKYFSHIQVLNTHYDKNARSIQLNYGLPKVFAFNETGLMPPVSPQYRIQGWQYLLSGGALYNNLDYTYQANGYEDGTGTTAFHCNWYNGCTDRNMKYQLRHLLDFMNAFDFVHCKPMNEVILCMWGDKQAFVLGNPGKEYAFYEHGGSHSGIQFMVVPGKYHLRWIHPADGTVLREDEIETDARGYFKVVEPAYTEDIACLIKRI